MNASSHPHRSLLIRFNFRSFENWLLFQLSVLMVEIKHGLSCKNNCNNNNWKVNLEATQLDKDIISIFLLTDANNRRILLSQDAVWLVAPRLEKQPSAITAITKPPPHHHHTTTPSYGIISPGGRLMLRAVAAKTFLFEGTYSTGRLRLAP